MSIGVARNVYIYSNGLNKINIYISLFGLISNIIFNYLLIPRFGISGSAASSLISQILTSYISSLFFKELHGNFILATKALYIPRINFKYF
jgi:O-antigen/teichoic acid export membrane protein